MKPTTKINVNNICSIDRLKRTNINQPVFETKNNDNIMSFPSLEEVSCILQIEMNNKRILYKAFKTEAELISFELEITERDKNLSNFIEI